MATLITGSIEWTSGTMIPQNGDAPTAGNVSANGLSDLTNRTNWLSASINFQNTVTDAYDKNRTIEVAAVQFTEASPSFATSENFNGFTDTASGYVLAVGALGIVSSSNAGRSWISGTLDSYVPGTLNSICSGSAPTVSIVAVGGGGGIYSISAPGSATITRRTAGSSFSGTFRDVHWCDTFATPRFVAVGLNTEIQTSENGILWTRRLSSAGPSLHSIIDASGVGIAAGTTIRRSTDSGLNWTEVETGTQISHLAVGTTFGVERIVGVGTNKTIKWSIDGGLNWGDGIIDPRADSHPWDFAGVDFVDGTFLAITSGGSVNIGVQLFSSLNGQDWKLVSKKVIMKEFINGCYITKNGIRKLFAGSNGSQIFSSNIIPFFESIPATPLSF